MLQRLHDLVDSKFGFWFVTTVLVFVGTTANGYWQNYFAEQQSRESFAKRLNLEIEYRLSEFIAGLAHMTTKDHKLRSDYYTNDEVQEFAQAFLNVPKQLTLKNVLFLSMYPREFGDQSLASLLAQKASLCPNAAGVLKRQIAALTQGEFFKDYSNPEEMASRVEEALFPKNVTGEFFPYTDCPPKKPFC